MYKGITPAAILEFLNFLVFFELFWIFVLFGIFELFWYFWTFWTFWDFWTFLNFWTFWDFWTFWTFWDFWTFCDFWKKWAVRMRVGHVLCELRLTNERQLATDGPRAFTKCRSGLLIPQADSSNKSNRFLKRRKLCRLNFFSRRKKEPEVTWYFL